MAGRGLPRAVAPWGGGLLPARGMTGVPSAGGGAGGRVSPGVGPCHFKLRGMGLYPQPSAPESTLQEQGGLRGGGGGGGGWRLLCAPSHVGGGGFAGGSSARRGPTNTSLIPGPLGPFEDEPRIGRGGLRYP